MRGGIVEKNSVGFLVMLAQAFAMISDHDDKRVVIPARLFQIPNKSSQDGIGVSNLAVIQAIFVGLRIGRRRLVGIMGIVEMDPNEMRSGGMRGHPCFRVLHHIRAAPFDPAPARFCLGLRGKVVVEIEAAIQSRGQRVAVEDDRADEGRGVIAVRLQQRGQRGMSGRQRHGKIGDAMAAGQKAGQDAGVRSVGDRAGRERMSETNAVFRQPVERRRLNIFVAVAVDVVGAKGIDGDQKNVRPGGIFPCLSRPRSGSRLSRK